MAESGWASSEEQAWIRFIMAIEEMLNHYEILVPSRLRTQNCGGHTVSRSAARSGGRPRWRVLRCAGHGCCYLFASVVARYGFFGRAISCGRPSPSIQLATGPLCWRSHSDAAHSLYRACELSTLCNFGDVRHQGLARWVPGPRNNAESATIGPPVAKTARSSNLYPSEFARIR